MRNMSFALTTQQVIYRTKFVTRRAEHTWEHLTRNEILKAVDRVMGFKKGQRPRYLNTIVVLSTRIEPLDAITPYDVILEGFPGWTTEQFILFFLKHGGGTRAQNVRRIAFDYVDLPQQLGLFGEVA